MYICIALAFSVALSAMLFSVEFAHAALVGTTHVPAHVAVFFIDASAPSLHVDPEHAALGHMPKLDVQQNLLLFAVDDRCPPTQYDVGALASFDRSSSHS
jgi:hypothetical protein